jgi:GMP synthase (glutamine-hydrolysing)
MSQTKQDKHLHTGWIRTAIIACIANQEKSIYGIQFHPEVVHTEQGTEILKNFALKIWKGEKNVQT